MNESGLFLLLLLKTFNQDFSNHMIVHCNKSHVGTKADDLDGVE